MAQPVIRHPSAAWREMLLRLVVSAVSVLLTLGVLEAALRLFHPVGLHPTDTFLAAAREGGDGGPGGKTGSMALVPNASTRYRTDEFDTAVRINSRGLREREIPYEKPAGTYRVLVLGDSQTFGVGVEAEEAYPRVAESRLRARLRRPVEVINAGVPGTGTAHQLDYLEREGWKYRPDVVVAGFFYNDPGNNAACRLYAVREGKLVRAAAPEARARAFNEVWAQGRSGPGVMVYHAPEPVRPPEPPWVIRQFHLARMVREQLSRLAQARRPKPEAGHVADVGREMTRAVFAELDRQCRQHDAALLVVLLPSREECADRRTTRLGDRYGPLLRGAQGRPLDVLDPLPRFRAAGHESLYFRKDLHFNAAGHRLVAAELAERLRSLAREEPRTP